MSNVLVGVCGSAACFKSVALCSELAKCGMSVQVVLSPAAARLVRPLQFSCVTGRRALSEEWDPRDPAGMDHIALARAADLLLIAPASADRIGRLAHGLTGDLLGSTVMAFEQDKPRILAPAMNPVMWRHPALQRNLLLLEGDEWRRIGPVEGLTACGEEGEGRMVEPEEIVEVVLSVLQGEKG